MLGIKELLLLIGLLTYPIMAEAVPIPPTTIVIIGCRVDDFTGQPGRHDPNLAAKGWKDLEWHVTDGLELECKREEIPLEDQVAMIAPPGTLPLDPNFSDFAQCAAVAMSFSPKWEEANKGWAVMAVGCPTKITNGKDGPVIGYKMPDCPHSINGMDVTCKFDQSVI